MKEVEIISSSDASAAFTSVPYVIGDLREYSIHVRFSSASLNGTLELYASNDGEDWVPIPDSSQTVASGVSHLWVVMGAGYKAIKVGWDPSSGTGSLVAKLVVKELFVRAG